MRNESTVMTVDSLGPWERMRSMRATDLTAGVWRAAGVEKLRLSEWSGDASVGVERRSNV